MCNFLFGDSVLTLNYKYNQVTSGAKTFSNSYSALRCRPKEYPPQIRRWLGGTRRNGHLEEICLKTIMEKCEKWARKAKNQSCQKSFARLTCITRFKTYLFQTLIFKFLKMRMWKNNFLRIYLIQYRENEGCAPFRNFSEKSNVLELSTLFLVYL